MARPAGPAVAFIAEQEQQWAQDSSLTTHQPEIDDWWEPFGDLLGGKEEGILRAGVQKTLTEWHQSRINLKTKA
jgi:hypothetical protein